ncbi:DHA2 family efflux MFS transporter permease subunit [Nocardioides sp. QY071]|uniref:DHA2 family efflux MFS transporter permease subunit n=1 Tax=Nocardioides sp. QY071 TaxID=3044187 RepID=UPI002499B32F|nr:DHA2 family efflux MFS transporter permease subunit [Nocardioides sp. QY071]WGY00290.1 DHA2 family efflux MFS transporter permease subunit [Nocardioides sp. QY071]
MSQTAIPAPASAAAPLDRTARTVIAVVVLGMITTVLDATIVSVATDRLAAEFTVSLTTIQWVMTGYLLAFTATIPLAGWAMDRYGARRVWLLAVGVFTFGSLLCGTAWSAPSLIGFRVLQGAGAGLVSPVGIAMVARAVGPRRMGRAMAVVGIPMMLGPILGPVLGGVLIDSVDWRWIFLVNIPVGLACLAWSVHALADARGAGRERLDVLGLALLSPGLVALAYGVTALAAPTGSSTEAATGIAGGVMLLVAFVAHALRTERPLVELRHFATRGFATATAVQFLAVGVLTGAGFLLPLYHLLARGETELQTGLLLVPQGVGAALAMALTGRLVDRGRGRAVVLAGVGLLVAGFLGYTAVGSDPGQVYLGIALFAIGLGAGCIFAPTSAAAYAALDHAAIPRATTTMSIAQRTGGVVATAVFATVLQHQLSAAAAPADAFSAAFWWPLAVAVLAVVPAVLLPASKAHTGTQGA